MRHLVLKVYTDNDRKYFQDINQSVNQNDYESNDVKNRSYSDQMRELMSEIDSFIDQHVVILTESNLFPRSLDEYIAGNIPPLKMEILRQLQRFGDKSAEPVLSAIQITNRRNLDMAEDERTQDSEKSEGISSANRRKTKSFSETREEAEQRTPSFVEDVLIEVLKEFSSENMHTAARILSNHGYSVGVIEERLEEVKHRNGILLRKTTNPLISKVNTLVTKSFDHLMERTEEFDRESLEVLGLDPKSLEESPKKENSEPKKDDDPRPTPPKYVDIFEASKEEIDAYLEAQKQYSLAMQAWKERHPEPKKTKDLHSNLDDLII